MDWFWFVSFCVSFAVLLFNGLVLDYCCIVVCCILMLFSCLGFVMWFLVLFLDCGGIGMLLVVILCGFSVFRYVLCICLCLMFDCLVYLR